MCDVGITRFVSMKTPLPSLEIIPSCIFALLLAGCATGGVSLRKPDLSRVAVGMSKPEVIAALGKPHQVSAEGGRETLLYGHDPVDGVMEIYWYGVMLANGRVVSYGPAGIHQADTSALFAMAANSQAIAASAQAMKPPQRTTIVMPSGARRAQQDTFVPLSTNPPNKTYRTRRIGPGEYETRSDY